MAAVSQTEPAQSMLRKPNGVLLMALDLYLPIWAIPRLPTFHLSTWTIPWPSNASFLDHAKCWQK
eukprot:COSAG01_NODE_3162_length_6478_cov_6.251450_10_plen_65_part_00